MLEEGSQRIPLSCGHENDTCDSYDCQYDKKSGQYDKSRTVDGTLVARVLPFLTHEVREPGQDEQDWLRSEQEILR